MNEKAIADSLFHQLAVLGEFVAAPLWRVREVADRLTRDVVRSLEREDARHEQETP